MLCSVILVLLICSPFLFLLWHGVSNKLDRRWCESKKNLRGKTAVVTGASAGIGKETARDFAKRGARVILACRNLVKAQNVADSIKKETGNRNIFVYKLDTSDLKSVRNCAKEILNKEKRLDILVNNAGTGGGPQKTLNQDGFEMTMATNYYGPFLLTNLLLGLMMKSGSGRIVNVSSQLHRFCFFLDPKNLDFSKSWIFNTLSSYSQSKLCLNLFTLELAKRLKAKRSGVTVNVLHPGFVATEIFSKQKMFIAHYVDKASVYIANSVEQGAQTSIYLSVSEEVENISGKYFDNCQQCSPSGSSENEDLSKELWTASVKDVKLSTSEMFL